MPASRCYPDPRSAWPWRCSNSVRPGQLTTCCQPTTYCQRTTSRQIKTSSRSSTHCVPAWLWAHSNTRFGQNIANQSRLDDWFPSARGCCVRPIPKPECLAAAVVQRQQQSQYGPNCCEHRFAPSPDPGGRRLRKSARPNLSEPSPANLRGRF